MKCTTDKAVHILGTMAMNNSSTNTVLLGKFQIIDIRETADIYPYS